MSAYAVVIFLLQNSIYPWEKDHRKDDGWTVAKESGYVIVSCEFVGTDLINLFEREFIDDDGCDMLFCFCCWICKLCKNSMFDQWCHVYELFKPRGGLEWVRSKTGRWGTLTWGCRNKETLQMLYIIMSRTCSGTIHQLTSVRWCYQIMVWELGFQIVNSIFAVWKVKIYN